MLALACGLALRLFLLAHYPHVNGDSLTYGDIARNWMLHGVYGQSSLPGLPPDPTLMRLPGYPAVIAAVFAIFGMQNYFWLLVVQVVFDLAGCLLIGAIARRLFGSRAGTAAVWTSCLCIFTASYSVAALAECLSVFCTAWAFYAFLRWRDAFAVSEKKAATLHLISLSLALVVAVLLRPDNGLLAAALVPTVFWITMRRAGLQKAVGSVAITAILFALPLAPWTVRNYRVFHVFQPLSPKEANDPGDFVTRGFNRWCSTWMIDYASTEETYWSPQTAAIDIADLPERAFDSPAQRAETVALFDEYNANLKSGVDGGADTPALDAKFMALAQERLRAHPIRTRLLVPFARLMNMWLRPRVDLYDGDLHWWDYAEHPLETDVAYLLGAVNLLYIVLAKIGWWKSRPRDALVYAMCAFVLLRCLLLFTIDNSEPRYTIVCFPVLFLLGAAVFRRKNEVHA